MSRYSGNGRPHTSSAPCVVGETSQEMDELRQNSVAWAEDATGNRPSLRDQPTLISDDNLPLMSLNGTNASSLSALASMTDLDLGDDPLSGSQAVGAVAMYEEVGLASGVGVPM